MSAFPSTLHTGSTRRSFRSLWSNLVPEDVPGLLTSWTRVPQISVHPFVSLSISSVLVYISGSSLTFTTTLFLTIPHSVMSSQTPLVHIWSTSPLPIRLWISPPYVPTYGFVCLFVFFFSYVICLYGLRVSGTSDFQPVHTPVWSLAPTSSRSNPPLLVPTVPSSKFGPYISLVSS